ncbi:hypothetical protein PR202_gb07045 [Eleusine coracana subsp. coracana]|uniref:DUF1618 domain-containing protein n=1 Tax=Eleusine coracana subsp. coracana TaxID=191504 RepID=A0AAV5E8Q4_ELECO|nr:hypothetical protein PR202_gb07045 [Eleusine coracana subsp. coracana]
MPEPAVAASPGSDFPAWVLLDTRGSPGRHLNATTAGAVTSTGHPIEVSFQLVDPPSLSRCFFHYAGSTPTSGSSRYTAAACVTGADGAFLLVRFSFPDPRGGHWMHNDVFVYRAGPGAPSLDLLPQPYPIQLHKDHVAVSSCDGDDHCLVVVPRPRFDPWMVYDLHVFSTRTNSWSTKVARVAHGGVTSFVTCRKHHGRLDTCRKLFRTGTGIYIETDSPGVQRAPDPRIASAVCLSRKHHSDLFEAIPSSTRSAMREVGVVSPSFMLLDNAVDLDELVGTPGPEWESIYCASKKAYGCGEHGRNLVEGLELYVRRLELPDLTSSLSIRLSDEALRSIQAEFGVSRGRVEAEGAVQIVSEQFLVLLVMFSLYDRSKLLYYLVFDSTNASLCMVPKLPSGLATSYTLKAVPVRTADDKDHDLVLMGRDIWEPISLGHVRLCMCTPAMRMNSSSASDGAGPWKATENLPIPRLPHAFSANVMFSFQGKAFWADLSQGVLCCDLRARDTDGGFKLNFIQLPKAYRIPLSEANPNEQKELHKSRTIGCAGDSIKFICVHPRHRNEMVKVWTLDLDHQRWKESKGIPRKELCRKAGFIHAEIGDAIVPQCPTLMPDGTLCLLLGKKAKSLKGPASICSFHIGSKSLVSTGRVVDYDVVQPVVVPYNFFTLCNPPSRKRKLPKHARELSMRKKKVPAHKMKLPTIMKEKPKRGALAVQVVLLPPHFI